MYCDEWIMNDDVNECEWMCVMNNNVNVVWMYEWMNDKMCVIMNVWNEWWSEKMNVVNVLCEWMNVMNVNVINE